MPLLVYAHASPCTGTMYAATSASSSRISEPTSALNQTQGQPCDGSMALRSAAVGSSRAWPTGAGSRLREARMFRTITRSTRQRPGFDRGSKKSRNDRNRHSAGPGGARLAAVAAHFSQPGSGPRGDSTDREWMAHGWRHHGRKAAGQITYPRPPVCRRHAGPGGDRGPWRRGAAGAGLEGREVIWTEQLFMDEGKRST